MSGWVLSPLRSWCAVGRGSRVVEPFIRIQIVHVGVTWHPGPVAKEGGALLRQPVLAGNHGKCSSLETQSHSCQLRDDGHHSRCLLESLVSQVGLQLYPSCGHKFPF